MGSSLVEVTVTASSGSELTFSGGNVARSTVGIFVVPFWVWDWWHNNAWTKVDLKQLNLAQ
eukprot:SAG31_NODE_1814_length_7210_cov_12.878920_4_plen_61_part_01